MNRRDPFTDVEELIQRVDREFGKLGAGFELPGSHQVPVDVVDGPEAVTVVADLPGCEEESIAVELDEDVLTIAATPTGEGVSVDDPETSEANGDGTEPNHGAAEPPHGDESASSDERTYRIRERRHGRVSRGVPVDADVDAASATATYDAGVLTVTLPKRSAGDTHRIDVE